MVTAEITEEHGGPVIENADCGCSTWNVFFERKNAKTQSKERKNKDRKVAKRILAENE